METENKSGCDYISGIIIDYIDGELDTDTSALVARHICECADCRKLYNDMKAVCHAAGDCAYDAPDSLHPGVMCAVRRDKARVRNQKMRKISAFAGVAAAAVICICVGITTLLTGLNKNDVEKLTLMNDGVYGTMAPEDPTPGYLYNLSKASDDNSYMKYTPQEKDTEKMLTGENGEEEADASLMPPTLPAADNTEKGKDRIDSEGWESANQRLAGTWTLYGESGEISVILWADGSYTVVDSTGKTTTGNYEADEDSINFYHPDGVDGYSYTINGNYLGLTPLPGSGTRLIG